jgi:hypothetical protein
MQKISKYILLSFLTFALVGSFVYFNNFELSESLALLHKKIHTTKS